MPTSAAEGRGWVAERLAATTSPVIVDVGAGEGTYSILGRHLRLDARWIGLEIHPPYVERYRLMEKYDEVHLCDVRRYSWPERGFVALCGDVLEHLPHADAITVLEALVARADAVMVSLPIIESIQGAVGGNVHEAHLHQWTFDEMHRLLGGCDAWRGEILGRFWWTR